jgi:hypothetical protein
MRTIPATTVIAVVVGLASPALGDPGDVDVTTHVKRARGGMTRAEVERAIDGEVAFARCYETTVAASSSTTINATATVTVANGEVTRLTLAKAPKKMRPCLDAAIRALPFPARSIKTTLTIGLRLKRRAEEATARAMSIIGEDTDPLGRGDADLAAKAPPSPPPPSAREVAAIVDQKIVSGPLTSDAIVLKIRSAYLSGVKRCVLGASDTGRDMVLAFEVGVDGKPANITASNAGDIDECIVARAAGWRFPASKGAPTKIELAFMFTPVLQVD